MKSVGAGEFIRVSTRRAVWALALAAALAAAQDPLTVRVLPQALAVNHTPLRIGLQVGFLEGAHTPFRAECLDLEAPGAEPGVTVKTVRDPHTGQRVYAVVNAGERAGGVVFTTAPLRKGVGYTVRVRGRREKGAASLRFRFSPVRVGVPEATERAASLKGGGFSEKAFEVTPHRDGVFQCSFQLEPGAQLSLADFSMMPDDAVEGWDSQALEALRAVGPGVLRWPVARGVVAYNWYAGVGPKGLRRAVSPTARPEEGHDFGTVEFVRFCRLAGAEPLMRVPVGVSGGAAAGMDRPEAAAQLAADWVSYCNAPSNQPLGELRARHGFAAPLEVRRWELAAPDGVQPEAASFAAACRSAALAMRAADPTIRLSLSLAPGGVALLSNVLWQAGELLDEVSCGASGAVDAVKSYNRSKGRRMAWGDTRMEGRSDRYVAEVMRRLEAGGEAERAYYGEWYGALGLLNEALRQMREGCGTLCAPNHPESLLYRVPYAKRMLTETGLVLSLFNRYPAEVPLATQGLTEGADASFQVVVAWTEDDTALVAYVYNSGTERRVVQLDLTDLKGTFVFWSAEQLAAEITAARERRVVPVTRRQKAGSALTQQILVESQPASFTRVVVKR